MRAFRVLAAAAVVLGALTMCTAPPTPAPPTPTPPVPTGHPGPFDGGPVAAPRTHVLVGAWVRPRRLTDVERIAAVRGFEERLGRRLSIVNTYRRLEEPLGTVADRRFVKGGATLMVSWAVGDTRSITLGKSDDELRAGARVLRDLDAPVLLRFRWEMDRPGLAASIWSPRDYIDAWRHTRALFRSEGATNVSWVWCPTAEGFADGRAGDYYPGDDSVDWIGVDAYAGATLAPLQSILQPFLTWASGHRKPVILGEFGIGRGWGPQTRAQWITSGMDYVRTVPQIRAVAYFESDPDGRDDKRSFSLSDDPIPLAAFAAASRQPYFSP